MQDVDAAFDAWEYPFTGPGEAWYIHDTLVTMPGAVFCYGGDGEPRSLIVPEKGCVHIPEPGDRGMA